MQRLYYREKKKECSIQKSKLPWWLSGKEYACNAGDQGSISGSGRSPGEEIGNPLQYSCLGNPMDRGAWWATIHGVAEELDTLSDFTTSTTIYVFMYVYIYISLANFSPWFSNAFQHKLLTQTFSLGQSEW